MFWVTLYLLQYSANIFYFVEIYKFTATGDGLETNFRGTRKDNNGLTLKKPNERQIIK